MADTVKAQCGSCEMIDTYEKAHDTCCSHCGSKSLWRVSDESDVEKQYILGVDLANGKDRTIIGGVMNDGYKPTLC